LSTSGSGFFHFIKSHEQLNKYNAI
jgi:hypothetical protein